MIFKSVPNKINILLFFAILISSFFLFKPKMTKPKEPDYIVIKDFDGFELRNYNSMNLAQIIINGSRKESISAGFKVLADYIFGNNLNKQKIAMTAPVQQQMLEKDVWQISFIIPSNHSYGSIPIPNNDNIEINSIGKKCYLVLKFSGSTNDENIKINEEILLEKIKDNGIIISGNAKYAFYNPPWIPSFMRKNEVMVECDCWSK